MGICSSCLSRRKSTLTSEEQEPLLQSEVTNGELCIETGSAPKLAKPHGVSNIDRSKELAKILFYATDHLVPLFQSSSSFNSGDLSNKQLNNDAAGLNAKSDFQLDSQQQNCSKSLSQEHLAALQHQRHHSHSLEKAQHKIKQELQKIKCISFTETQLTDDELKSFQKVLDKVDSALSRPNRFQTLQASKQSI